MKESLIIENRLVLKNFYMASDSFNNMFFSKHIDYFIKDKKKKELHKFQFF